MSSIVTVSETNQNVIITVDETNENILVSVTEGAANLAQLNDTTITNPVTGESLLYDSVAETWENGTLSGSGDMLKATYDPSNVNSDAFDMANMVESATAKILTDTERAAIAANTAKKSDTEYTHNQPLPSATWVINHNLDKYPSITIVDTSGNIVEGEETFTDSNNVTIVFTASFAGKAYLN